jgi:quinol monooxygenase YgiN
MIFGDEASGVVRGIGVYTDRPAADTVNSDPEFAAFNDAVAGLLANPPESLELELLHLFSREQLP